MKTYISRQKTKDFLRQGRFISYCIASTFFEDFSREVVEGIAKTLEDKWKRLMDNGVETEQIIGNNIIALAI